MSKRPRVLIVDDDPWFADSIAHGLVLEGFDVEVAPHALDGIKRIDNMKPAAIILDLFMPGPNGIVLLHELQSYSDLARIPIIICSNSAESISRRDLAAYGVIDVFDKASLRSRDLANALRGAIS